MSSFEPELYFVPGGRPALRFLQGRRKTIAMPTLAVPVDVETDGSTRRSPLHVAILELVKTGAETHDELAELLGLDSSLVELIADELVAWCELEREGDELRISDVGHRALEEREEPRIVRVFALFDALTGQMWPRLVRRLDDVEKNEMDEEFPELVGGTPGRPTRLRPWYIAPGGDWRRRLEEPDPIRIKRALQAHLRLEKAVGKKVSEYARLARDLGGVHRVHVDPGLATQLWLVTELYVPEDKSFDREWRAVDPFGFGDLPWLRRRLLEARGRGNSRISVAVAHLYPNDEKEPQSAAAAEFEIEDRFGVTIHSRRALLDRLVLLFAERRALRELSDASAAARHRRGSIARIVGELSEEILEVLGRGHPGAPDAYARAKLAGTDATRARITAMCGTPIADGLAGVLREEATTASRDKRPSGLAILFASALIVAAFGAPEHPLRALLIQRPGWQVRFDQLREFRNAHAHAGSHRQNHRAWDVDAHVDTLLQLLEHALPHLPEDRDGQG